MGEISFDMVCPFSKSDAAHVINRHSLQSKRKNTLTDFFDTHWPFFFI